MINFDNYSNPELEELVNEAQAELQRRQQVAAIPEEIT